MTISDMFKNLFVIVAGILLLLTAVTSFLVFGPTLEARFFPPVNDGFARIVQQKDGMTTILIGGNIQRPCMYRGTSALIMKGGQWQRASLTSDPKSIQTAIPGQQIFGIYVIYDTQFDHMKLIATHTCHALWNIVTNTVDTTKTGFPGIGQIIKEGD